MKHISDLTFDATIRNIWQIRNSVTLLLKAELRSIFTDDSICSMYEQQISICDVVLKTLNNPIQKDEKFTPF